MQVLAAGEFTWDLWSRRLERVGVKIPSADLRLVIWEVRGLISVNHKRSRKEVCGLNSVNHQKKKVVRGLTSIKHV